MTDLTIGHDPDSGCAGWALAAEAAGVSVSEVVRGAAEGRPVTASRGSSRGVLERPGERPAKEE